MGNPYLEFCDITQKFGEFKALDQINFAVSEGSVHALVGENGAGKSTLLKVLSGVNHPTQGCLKIDTQEKLYKNVKESLNDGVSIIYQELNIVPEMSVAENLMLGKMPKGAFGLDKRSLHKQAKKIMAGLIDEIAPGELMKNLPLGQWQMVEIAKAIGQGAKIIAFDEPTSSLSFREIERLFAVIEKLKNEGKVILYVSHRMDEIFQICDAITVFKDGQHVRTYNDTKDVTKEQLVKDMVGRELKEVYHKSEHSQNDVCLKVDNILGKGLNKPVSLEVKSGEILGLFGLVGAGRSELLKLLFGRHPIKQGQISIDGKAKKFRSVIDAIDNGLIFCPEDRKSEGIVGIHSVAENINIANRKRHLKAGFCIDHSWEKNNAKTMAKKLDVRTTSLKKAIEKLSGGNQQKAILARWLSEDMKIVLLDEPTRGIDVGAKAEIYQLIQTLAQEGKAVVVVSSDLPEVMGIADRIVVMREGEVVQSVQQKDFSEENLLKLALPQSA
ncbi:MAG: L-arabinose ABC transporter ATP-binding protein AraG [Alphaproteobacteria bacterium]